MEQVNFCVFLTADDVRILSEATHILSKNFFRGEMLVKDQSIVLRKGLNTYYELKTIEFPKFMGPTL